MFPYRKRANAIYKDPGPIIEKWKKITSRLVEKKFKTPTTLENKKWINIRIKWHPQNLLSIHPNHTFQNPVIQTTITVGIVEIPNAV